MTNLREPYQGYAYSYPHKTAYRSLAEPVPLRDLWRSENRESLFLYVHIPFCEMRCAFCNLFTQAGPRESLVSQYLDALKRQIDQTSEYLEDAKFARFALGGGTPPFLDLDDLRQVFDWLPLTDIPMSVEASPATIDEEKLAFLRERGVTRLSMGVQSFLEEETSSVARKQNPEVLETALQLLRGCRIPTINLDLIYGLPGQTEKTWRYSLQRVLEEAPVEIYLYPLYVRDLTGLGKREREWPDSRLRFYRTGRDFLLEQGYEQVSMRMFRRIDCQNDEGPIYCCQTDGMLGLGCGARSYTQSLHYSNEYAVGASGIREILTSYLSRSNEAFQMASYGYELDDEDQRRRFVIQSLLQVEGLSFPQYQERFGTSALRDLPQLSELLDRRLALESSERLCLTETGLELSDAIGPWLYSARARRLMEEYELQ